MNKIIERSKNVMMPVFLLLLFTIAAERAIGSKYVTVATIGNLPSITKYESSQNIVDQVKSFWLHEIKQVLPYKPDLILLPEECDFPSGGLLSPKEKEKYLAVRKNQMLDFLLP